MRFFFFFNDTATTEIYTLSLHDALPICLDWPVMLFALGLALLTGFLCGLAPAFAAIRTSVNESLKEGGRTGDRKSTRLNSSHSQISYAVFCLKKKTVTSLHKTATAA